MLTCFLEAKALCINFRQLLLDSTSILAVGQGVLGSLLLRELEQALERLQRSLVVMVVEL